MKNTILTITFIFFVSLVKSQDASSFKVYDTTADGTKQVAEAVALASKSGKHIMLQIGGNWCKWCRLFYKWSHDNTAVDSLLKADFEVIHINFSKENKNPELMSKLNYPQRFGFPVFVILDTKGNLLHTQNTGYLEEGEGYSEKKVIEFLKHWNRHAFDPVNYPH